jgi:hypothetical protein
MKLLRFCAAAALCALVASPAFANIPQPTPPPDGARIADIILAQATAPAATVTATPPVIAPAPAPATTTVTVPPSANPTTVLVPAAPAAPETPTWLNALAAIGIAITMGIFGLGLGILNKKAGLENNATAMAIESHARDALHTGLESLAGRGIVEFGPKINSIALNIQNPTIRALAQSAPGMFGDALKLFGLSPDTVAQKIIDKIGVLTASNPNVNPTSQPQPPAA